MTGLDIILAGVDRAGITTLAARLEGRSCGELSYIVTNELVGRHVYITNILVEHPRRAGIASALIAQLMVREPRLAIYVAPYARNSPAGNALFTAWNGRHRRKIRWHAEG